MSASAPGPRAVIERSAPKYDVGEPSDEHLLLQFGRSEPEGSAAFIARFQRRVFGLSRTIVGDPRAAEDVAQEALVRVWRHADAFDGRRGSVATWVLQITRKVAIDAMRKRRPTTIAPDDIVGAPGSERDPADIAVLGDDIEWLRDALVELPEEQRRAVVLAGIWGVTAREIAERDGIPLGTAKTRIRLALGRLRDAMDRDRRVD
jgi:RNA polymerase sigma-70 factor (ECF subfamily)